MELMKLVAGIIVVVLQFGIAAWFLRDAARAIRRFTRDGYPLGFWACIDIVAAVFMLAVLIKVAFRAA